MARRKSNKQVKAMMSDTGADSLDQIIYVNTAEYDTFCIKKMKAWEEGNKKVNWKQFKKENLPF